MSSLNRIQLIGNLGGHPDVKDFDNNKKKVRLSVATSESYSSPDGQMVTQTEWHNVILWNKLADVAEKYLSKGRQVYIEGTLRTRSYEDNTGASRKITEVIGQRLILLGSRNENPSPSVAAPEKDPPVTAEDNLPF